MGPEYRNPAIYHFIKNNESGMLVAHPKAFLSGLGRLESELDQGIPSCRQASSLLKDLLKQKAEYQKRSATLLGPIDEGLIRESEKAVTQLELWKDRSLKTLAREASFKRYDDQFTILVRGYEEGTVSADTVGKEIHKMGILWNSVGRELPGGGLNQVKHSLRLLQESLDRMQAFETEVATTEEAVKHSEAYCGTQNIENEGHPTRTEIIDKQMLNSLIGAVGKFQSTDLEWKISFVKDVFLYISNNSRTDQSSSPVQEIELDTNRYFHSDDSPDCRSYFEDLISPFLKATYSERFKRIIETTRKRAAQELRKLDHFSQACNETSLRAVQAARKLKKVVPPEVFQEAESALKVKVGE